MNKILTEHNQKVLNDRQKQMYPQENTDLYCQCQVSRKANCPLPGRWSVTNQVYRATITRLDNNTTKKQTGWTVDFKQRYSQHLHSFSDENAKHTCLCNHAWRLKSSTPPIPYNIVWDIVARAAPYNLQSSHWVLWSMHRRKVQNHVWNWRCIPQSEVWIFCLLLSLKTSTHEGII